jgi:hypothetical protein
LEIKEKLNRKGYAALQACLFFPFEHFHRRKFWATPTVGGTCMNPYFSIHEGCTRAMATL